ncbi:hypothetical protein ABIE49_004315 [Bradyrhizobium sp. OAE829]
MPVSACNGCIEDGTCIASVLGRLARRVLLTALFVAQPAYAQKLHSYEPLMMDPFTTIYVNDGSCSAGKVLKVQGAPRNQRRKKSCVPMSDLKTAPR